MLDKNHINDKKGGHRKLVYFPRIYFMEDVFKLQKLIIKFHDMSKINLALRRANVPLKSDSLFFM